MIGVYNITFYKYDEDGNEVLNEDGSVKIFTLKPTIRFKPLEYLCEDLTDDLVIEVGNEWIITKYLKEVINAGSRRI